MSENILYLSMNSAYISSMVHASPIRGKSSSFPHTVDCFLFFSHVLSKFFFDSFDQALTGSDTFSFAQA